MGDHYFGDELRVHERTRIDVTKGDMNLPALPRQSNCRSSDDVGWGGVFLREKYPFHGRSLDTLVWPIHVLHFWAKSSRVVLAHAAELDGVVNTALGMTMAT